MQGEGNGGGAGRELAATASPLTIRTHAHTHNALAMQLAQLRQIMYENLRGLQQVQNGSEDLIGQSREIREQLGVLGGSGGGR